MGNSVSVKGNSDQHGEKKSFSFCGFVISAETISISIRKTLLSIARQSKFVFDVTDTVIESVLMNSIVHVFDGTVLALLGSVVKTVFSQHKN